MHARWVHVSECRVGYLTARIARYELHRQLVRKLRLRGLNALFAMRTTLAVGDSAIVATAQGTGVRRAAASVVRLTVFAVPRKRASVTAAGRHPHAGRRSGGSAGACAPRARVRRDEGTPPRPVRSVCSLPMGPQALQHEQESPRVSRSFTPPAGAAGDDDDDESVSPARVRACV
jgi:hypothetical protein